MQKKIVLKNIKVSNQVALLFGQFDHFLTQLLPTSFIGDKRHLTTRLKSLFVSFMADNLINNIKTESPCFIGFGPGPPCDKNSCSISQ